MSQWNSSRGDGKDIKAPPLSDEFNKSAKGEPQKSTAQAKGSDDGGRDHKGTLSDEFNRGAKGEPRNNSVQAKDDEGKGSYDEAQKEFKKKEETAWEKHKKGSAGNVNSPSKRPSGPKFG